MKRVLLDENLPKQLKNYFSSEYEVTAVPDHNWQAKKNGELLSAMSEAGIRYLMTADKNLRYQQNLDKFDVVVVVIHSYDHRLKNLSSHVATIETRIERAEMSERYIEIDLRKSGAREDIGLR